VSLLAEEAHKEIVRDIDDGNHYHQVAEHFCSFEVTLGGNSGVSVARSHQILEATKKRTIK
jgi:hypothetical protein